jgi:hypothetical protein
MGKQTIGDTAGGAWLQEFEKRAGALPKGVWEAASKKFAKGASGEVTALVEGSAPGSIFKTVELPALLQNPNVSQIRMSGTPQW